jgi:hypothetical protein
MIDLLRGAGQLVVSVALFAGVAAFSNWPAYRQLPEGQAVVTLSLVHGADRQAECRRLSPAEIAKLPPNMRRAQDCPRGRRPIVVELDLDGRTVFSEILPPTGIAGDGHSKVYKRFVIPTGEHDIAVRMRDTPRTEGFDHERKDRVTLAAEQMLVIDFDSQKRAFLFR